MPYPGNKYHYDLYNKLSLSKLKLSGTPPAPSFFEPQTDVEPIWITGFFRSGTTLLTRMLSLCGADVGTEDHLLDAKGTRGHLNAEGFFENYLFMEFSTFLFMATDTWGDQPPGPEQKFPAPAEIDYEDFARHCLVGMHDDRISNKGKVQILKQHYPGNLNDYLSSAFKGRPSVKNPHFCVLANYLQHWWPKSQFIVIFREPGRAIESAKRISPRITEETYRAYYEHLNQVENVIYVSYEHLVKSPAYAMGKLCDELGLNVNEAAAELVEDRSGPSTEVGAATRDLYQSLLTRAVNVEGRSD